jgi:hypothetical protein
VREPKAEERATRRVGADAPAPSRRRRYLPLLVAAACAAPSSAVEDAATRPAPGGPDAAPGPPVPAYPAEVTSLRLRRSIAVRFEPRADAKSLGTVEADTRVGWTRAAPGGPGCPRWIEIRPRGWVCDKYLEPTTKEPAGDGRPHLEADEIVPGVYGKVVGAGAKAYKGVAGVKSGRAARTLAGAVTVRKIEDVTVGGRAYWKTSSGELILAGKIAPHVPSRFAGVRLGGRALPMAWAQSRKNLTAPVIVLAGPDAKARPVAKLAPRTVVTPLEASGAFTRIGDSRWVARADLHVAPAGEPPGDLEPDGKWIDVDLDEQVATAYEGRTPIYATMVSTGQPKWPTAPGVYRIWLKLDETDMNGQMGDEQPYSVATVPWTMFFARDLGFHTAYWHDRFGEARSHGCINVAPLDARWLFDWAEPDLPPGWSMANGIAERPGTLVKIHSAAAPAPDYRGYAKVVHETQAIR